VDDGPPLIWYERSTSDASLRETEWSRWVIAERAFDGDDGAFVMEVSAALNACVGESPAEMAALLAKTKACLEGMHTRKMAVLKLCEQKEMDWQAELEAESKMATEAANVASTLIDREEKEQETDAAALARVKAREVEVESRLQRLEDLEEQLQRREVSLEQVNFLIS
jgi:hypothetical protein